MRPLSHLSAISVIGPDALAFCQSQVTSDLTALGPAQWHASAWCSANGKAIVVMLVRASESRVEWIMPKSQVADTARALSRYTIGRQVTISEPLSVAGDWAHPGNDSNYPRLAHDPSRILYVDETKPNGLDDSAFLVDWRLADLEAGLSWLCPELSMRFLPQSLGLERLSGLSYRKGCYPGQEVIAKVHYRGQLKHHLVFLGLNAQATTLPADTPLYHHTSQATEPAAAKPCGVIIDQVANRALAVVRSTIGHGERLFVDTPDRSNERLPIGEVIDLTSAQNRKPVS